MSFINYYKAHINSIINTFEKLDCSKIEQLIDLIQNCNGNVLFTGVGKNGHVAAKASSTFCSIGIRSFFLNPVDSVHGDMGAVNENDLLILITKSGNTDELITFLKFFERKKCKIISLHSNQLNQSLKYSFMDINLHVDKEADDLNTIPTSSIAIFTIFLQSIACELAHRTGLTLEEFVFNHPGGSIGKLK
jgi:arabinose-5-phosphate isomerase